MKHTALISVYHKQGIYQFAKELEKLDWQIIASGGTAKHLKEKGIKVKDIADLIGGAAILGHRVVTLSRKTHAGLLARDIDQDLKELEKLGFPRIDLVCVDLYPLKEEIDNPKSNTDSIIEKTDVGGPTLLHSASKGQRIVVSDPKDRIKVIKWIKAGQPQKEEVVRSLIAKAEKVVSDYTLLSANYHSDDKIKGFIGQRTLECKYGENAWQTPAALYKTGIDDPLSLDKFSVIAGTSPSYNNLSDLDRLLQTVTHISAGFDLNFNYVPYIAVAVKHGNPCGAAISRDSKEEAIKQMISGDTRAIFGGLVMVNFELDEKLSELLITHLMDKNMRRLLDGVIAPSITDKALESFKRKKDKCRLLINPSLSSLNKKSLDQNSRFRYVRGGFLNQPNYQFVLNLNDSNVEKYGKIDKDQEENILLGWAIGSTSNSNTITVVSDKKLLGDGVAQQDRVGACKVAIFRANESNHKTKGSVAYSDSFFPFNDGPEELKKAGIKAIFTSSGSINDKEMIKFCRKNKIALYMIPDKLGRGFFGH